MYVHLTFVHILGKIKLFHFGFDVFNLSVKFVPNGNRNIHSMVIIYKNFLKQPTMMAHNHSNSFRDKNFTSFSFFKCI